MVAAHFEHRTESTPSTLPPHPANLDSKHSSQIVRACRLITSSPDNTPSDMHSLRTMSWMRSHEHLRDSAGRFLHSPLGSNQQYGLSRRSIGNIVTHSVATERRRVMNRLRRRSYNVFWDIASNTQSIHRRCSIHALSPRPDRQNARMCTTHWFLAAHLCTNAFEAHPKS